VQESSSFPIKSHLNGYLESGRTNPGKHQARKRKKGKRKGRSTMRSAATVAKFRNAVEARWGGVLSRGLGVSPREAT